MYKEVSESRNQSPANHFWKRQSKCWSELVYKPSLSSLKHWWKISRLLPSGSCLELWHLKVSFISHCLELNFIAVLWDPSRLVCAINLLHSREIYLCIVLGGGNIPSSPGCVHTQLNNVHIKIYLCIVLGGANLFHHLTVFIQKSRNVCLNVNLHSSQNLHVYTSFLNVVLNVLIWNFIHLVICTNLYEMWYCSM